MQETKTIHDLLKNLDSLDKIRELISILGFSFADKPLPTRDFKDSLRDAMVPESLRIIGDAAGFPVIFFQKAKKEKGDIDRQLFRLERELIKKLPAEHQDACVLIVASPDYSRLHFINPKRLDKRLILRRYIVGPDQNMRTAGDRLSYLRLQDVSRWDVVQERVEKAFDVEEVTKEFFKVFADLYHKVADDIALVKGLEDKAGKLAQLLLDRLIFLYFIQKKGWLNQDKNYLYDRFETCWDNDPKGCNYYSDFLFPLFQSLADADLKPLDGAHVPFLNGGLFEDESKQDQMELLAKARLKVRNKTFRDVFDRLLEKFNFTVTEHTPYDVEVAIDPEMLGKIFENLILQLEKDPDKDLRKLTGSYYTPRPIVHFMCQEALKEYLVSQLAGDDAKQAEKYREKIDTLMDMPAAYQIDEETESTLSELFTKPEAKVIRQAVLDCRVCDPAVGSGAFPIGLLHEMIGVISRIDLMLKGRKALKRRNYDYDLKKQIIENCIYGVDIQEQAVRLCELRLWLSLIVDYEIDKSIPFDKAIRQVPSLPNLSYRIVQGDSLLERLFGHVIQLDKLAEDAATKQLIESVQADKSAYFREGNTKEKRRLELKILTKQADLAERLIEAKRNSMTTYQTNIFGDDGMSAKDRKAKAEYEIQLQELGELKQKVSKAKSEIKKLPIKKTSDSLNDIYSIRKRLFQNQNSPTFIWRVDFAEVFNEHHGFDIVFGNPPYLSHDKLTDKHAFEVNYQSYEPFADIYCFFIELGNRILNSRGILCFITSNSYLRSNYGLPLRKFLSNNSSLLSLINIEDYQVFDTAIVNTSILISSRVTESRNIGCSVVNTPYEPHLSFRTFVDTHNFTIDQQEFQTNTWVLLPPEILRIKKIIDSAGRTLEDYETKIRLGLATGANHAFVIDDATRADLIRKNHKNADLIKPILRGRDIHKFHYEEPSAYILLTKNSINVKKDYPDIYKYLSSFGVKFKKRGAQGKHWTNLRACSFFDDFKEEKIIWIELSDIGRFAICRDEIYLLNSAYFLIPPKQFNSKYLLGILNSDVIQFYLSIIAETSGMGTNRWINNFVKLFPMPESSKQVQVEIGNLVDSIIGSVPGSAEHQNLLDQLNLQVANIYNLSEVHMRVIRERLDTHAG